MSSIEPNSPAFPTRALSVNNFSCNLAPEDPNDQLTWADVQSQLDQLNS